MNILSIYTSHDGCMTYIKDNKIIFHTQLDRYNRFKYYSFPVKQTIKELEENLAEVDKLIEQARKTNPRGLGALQKRKENIEAQLANLR